MNSPLHREIGDILRNLEKSMKIESILAKECGGSQDIPLFLKQPKSNETEICNVDAMVIKNGKIKIIIEIEESNNKPTQICGKYLTSNLATLYAHDSLPSKDKELKIDKSSITFIQVIDSKDLPERSSKLDQLNNIETAINILITAAMNAEVDHGCIKKYVLTTIDANKTGKEKTLFEKFKNLIVEGII
jgi:hypothetical protein